MERYKDIIGGVFWLVVAVGMYYASFSIRVLAIGTGSTTFVGSGFMPRLVACGMILLSAIIIWQTWKKIHASCDASDGKGQLTARERYLPVFASLALFIVYIALMEFVGFVTMTALYLFGQMSILATPEHRKPVLFIIVAVVGAVAINYTFVEVFQLMLPESRLF